MAIRQTGKQRVELIKPRGGWLGYFNLMLGGLHDDGGEQSEDMWTMGIPEQLRKRFNELTVAVAGLTDLCQKLDCNVEKKVFRHLYLSFFSAQSRFQKSRFCQHFRPRLIAPIQFSQS